VRAERLLIGKHDLHDIGEPVSLLTTATVKSRAEEAEDSILKVVHERQALPFLEIASLKGMRISELTAVVKDLASKEKVKLYGPDDPSNRVVAISGSYR
jgi:hypothetical protein